MACEICKKPYKAPLNDKSVDSNEKPHVCNICGKSFSLKIQLKRHVLFHEEDAPYICNICEKHLEKTSYNLRLSHKGNFPCETCNKSFASKRLLLRHASEHTLDNVLNCDECGKCFKSVTALKRHAAVHKPKKKDSKRNLLKGDSPKSNPVKDDLLKSDSLNINPTKGNPIKVAPVDSDPPKSKPLKGVTRKQISKSSHLCSICGKRFSQLQQLKKHQLTHEYHSGAEITQLQNHQANGSCQSKNNTCVDPSEKNVEDKKHVCDICNKSFTRKSALEGHVVSHFTDGHESQAEDDSDVDADFQCNYQNSNNSLEQPQQQCLPKLKICRSFPCETCEVVCATKKMLDKHMTSHEKIEECERKKNYTCRVCDKEFDTKELYRVHKFSHEIKVEGQDNKDVEKKSLKYACQLCHTMFPKKRYLRKHLKSHFNGDPNETTSLSSEEMQNVKKRKKRVKNFECGSCGKRFVGETCFRKHEAKHNGTGDSDSSKGKKDKKAIVTLVCDFCGEDFTGRRPFFLKHKLSHTPEVCGICDARFVDRASLREHCRIHVGTEEGRRFMQCSQKALNAKNGVAAPEPKVEYIYLVLR